MDNFIKNIKFLFMPHFWIMNERYSKSFDMVVNSYFDNFEIEIVDSFTIKLGNLELWTENYPYSCLVEYSRSKSKIRPSRQTIYKRMKEVYKAREKYLLEKHKFDA